MILYVQLHFFRSRLKRVLFVVASLSVVSLFLLHRNATLLNQAFLDYRPKVNMEPGGFLSERVPNDSYCNYRLGLPEELLYVEDDLDFSPEEGVLSPYRVIYNVIERKEDAAIPNITYVTHMSPNFVNYLAEVVRFWEGYVSVAAFIPDFDADLTLVQLKQLCSCLPEMSKVSVHFVFPSNHPPYLQNHSAEEEEERANCKIVVSSNLSTFRSSVSMEYPINVCRNVARNAALTSFVMVSDIQLIPSDGLATKFMKLMDTLQVKDTSTPSRVFVVPVFEVEKDDIIPRRKEDLLVMIKEERAVYFHRHVCSHCQKFPGINTWMNSWTSSDSLKQFGFAKREYPFHRWEPIYIGSKNEPLYSEELSWEGLQDKMAQMLEMCLIGYKFVILDGAFLVHWPGIKRSKHMSLLENYWRATFLKYNQQRYEQIVKRLGDSYEPNPKCRLQ